MKRWHVVCGAEDRTHLVNEQVWTVSKNPDEPGWNTDSGYPGYGLTKVDAEFLAAAANEKFDREADAEIKPPLRVGDRVRARGGDEIGKVLAIDGDEAWIVWPSGNRSTWPVDGLFPAGDSAS